MVTKRNHLLTDSVREIWKTRNRFFSILVLTALAVAFSPGCARRLPIWSTPQIGIMTAPISWTAMCCPPWG